MKSDTLIRCLVLMMMLSSSSLWAQQEGVTIRGGISAGGELYNVAGIPNRRSPYSYQISGRVVFSYKDFSIPITGSYRDAQFSYDFTFNRLGIAPTYKWIKVYLGWNTMQFSQYTMSGRAFNGIGVELKPGNFVFAALRGKIQNPLAIRDTLVDGANLIPIYDRRVVGGKIGYGKNKNKVELIFMRMHDDITSFTPPDYYQEEYAYNRLTPKENITVGFNAGISLFKRLDLYINTGASAFTADASDTLLLDYGRDVPAFVRNMFTANSTSRLALAGDAGMNFRLRIFRLGLKYRRVEPFYTTLASNYFNQDLEQYTFQLGTDFLKRKIRFDGSLGLEKNNLTQLRMNTTHRVIGQGNVSFTPNESFFTSVNYSNYQTESENRIFLLNDTLRFVSVSAQYGLVSNLNFRNEARVMTFGFNAFYNTVRDQSEVAQIGDINILSLNLNHGYQILPWQLTIGPSIHFNQYNYSETSQRRFGGGLKLTKRFGENKLNLNASFTYSLNTYDGLNDGNVGFYSLTAAYKVTPKSTISLNASYRDTNSLITRSFRETRVALRYNYNF